MLLLWEVSGDLTAQTNQPCAPLRLFSVSELQLRAKQEPREAAPLAASSSSATNSISVEAQAPIDGVEEFAERYRWMNGRDLLTRTVHSEGESFYSWLTKNPFELEVIRTKQFLITGSLVTAVKRKNPLCLINPRVFYLGW